MNSSKGKTKPAKFNWSSLSSRNLIEFIKPNDFLYNPKHPNYKKTALREKVLRDVALNIGCSVADVKTRWEGLRTYFSRELSKVASSKKSASGSDDVYEPKWEFFNDMEFLKTLLQTRKARSSLEYEQTTDMVENDRNPEEICEQTLSCFSDKIIELQDEGDKKEEREKIRAPSSSSSTSAGACSSHNEYGKNPRKKKRKENHTSRVTEEYLGEALLYLKNPPPTKKDTSDEHDLFGAFVASQMRGLNTKVADKLRCGIMQMIFEKKHENFDD